ncbi:MAG: hypothetical protein IJ705_01990 [Oscillospiraceae bacterium]|nr:hypothetical protein [Oscillospiraceae bacterium]
MKQFNPLFYTLWSAAIILCVAVSIFAFFFSACSKQKGAEDGSFRVENEAAEPSQEPEQEAEEAPAPSAGTARLGETPDAGHAYLDKITFLGDSTTYGIGYYYNQGYTDLCPPEQVWTPASGTLTLSYYNIATIVYPETEEELTIAEAVERSKPEYLMLTLGVNGVSFMDEEWFLRDYGALIDLIREASPDTKVILNSIYPVAASYKWLNDINNDKIRAANVWIEQLAESKGVRFLNSYECLVGPDGNLPEEDQNGDGIHLNGEAFTKVMEYIRTHACP